MSFESELETWAANHFKSCYESMNTKDDAWRKKCLGAIVRQRAKLELSWFWRACDQHPKDVVRLSPYIGRFETRGYEVPPDNMTWGEYVRAMQVFAVA